jgi:prepilin-type N-terminal cleavage/methylation domain-containing protein
MKHPRGGFTFIELVFAIAILAVVVSGVYTLILSLNRNYQDQVAIAETQQAARVALSIFSNEIQNAGLDPTGTAFNDTNTTKSNRVPVYDTTTEKCSRARRPAEKIMEASQTVFHFMGDLNGSGAFNQSCSDDTGSDPCDRKEDIRYEWVGEGRGPGICRKGSISPYTLYRYTGKGAEEVVGGIKTFNLTYYDENNKPLLSGMLSKTDMKLIRKMIVTVEAVTTGDKVEKRRTLTSEIFLKNIG